MLTPKGALLRLSDESQVRLLAHRYGSWAGSIWKGDGSQVLALGKVWPTVMVESIYQSGEGPGNVGPREYWCECLCGSR